ncbi:BBE domain-containing protein [Yinghuangia aomiensis]
MDADPRRAGALARQARTVNYIDASLPDWGTAYYGRNRRALKQVARHYRPGPGVRFPPVGGTAPDRHTGPLLGGSPSSM